MRTRLTGLIALSLAFVLWSADPANAAALNIKDASGRSVKVMAPAQRVVCSGAGCLRLLSYLGAQNRVCGVDSSDKNRQPVESRPYAAANPQFQKLPLCGEGRGVDNPELIATINPQLIFKVTGGPGPAPQALQTATGIPVVALNYGNLTFGRADLDASLRLMGRIMGRERRAAELIAYLDATERDLQRRTAGLKTRPSCYVSGLSNAGPHGLQSTDPCFAPFKFANANNVAAGLSTKAKPLSHAVVAKEQIITWDPEVIFLDVASLRLTAGAGALDQLKHDPAYRKLKAVRTGRVYGLLPNNAYNANYECILANAYYVGKVLYPERFKDIDPLKKAEEIATYLNGKPSIASINQQYGNQALRQMNIK